MSDSSNDSKSEMPASSVRAAFSEVINRVAYGKERVVITRHDHAVAALVPVEDLESLEQGMAAQEGEAGPPSDAPPSNTPAVDANSIPAEVYEKIRREVYEQVHEEAQRKLEAMMRPRSR